MKLQSVNPATGENVRAFAPFSLSEIHTCIDRADHTFRAWSQRSFSERSQVLNNVAQYLIEKKQTLAEIITLEMGKPMTESLAEVEKCAWVCQYYANHASSFLQQRVIESDAKESYVHYEPLGVILAIMPWNFPFWQVFRFAAPALMAGNVCLLKHASNVSMCALEIERMFRSVFSQEIFTTLLVTTTEVNNIIAHPLIKAVTLTGSEGAGIAVSSEAGQNIKKTVLELGGSDPFIVLNDADIEHAADSAIKGRFLNSGQSCIAAKRFLVESVVYEQFIYIVTKKIRNLKTGDPMNPETQIGPIARMDLLEGLINQVQESVQEGARLLLGGKKMNIPGAFMEPTLLEGAKGTLAFREEIFGPVMAVAKVKDSDEAIQIANESQFGLGASIWTSDMNRARQMALKIESGSVFINGIVKSDPRLPFGGIKKSGYGRELSEEGIREFVNIKTIWIK